MLHDVLLVLPLLGLVLLDQLLGQDDMAEVGDEVCVNPHLDERGLLAQQIDDLDAHRLYVQRGVLAQIEEDLQAFNLVETVTDTLAHLRFLVRRLTLGNPLLVSFRVQKEHFE